MTAARSSGGRKRHLVVEIQGLVLRGKAHSVAVQDRAALPVVLAGISQDFPRLQHTYVDSGYSGTGKKWMETNLG